MSALHGGALQPAVEYVGEDDFTPTVHTVQEIAAGFRAGDAAALAAVLAAQAEGRSFGRVYESNPVNYLVHAVVHDAHHRGQIMSMLRQSGRTIEEMDALEGQTWPIWRE